MHEKIRKWKCSELAEFRSIEGWPKIARSWASDTFLIYAVDDSADAFQTIEHVSRWFYAQIIKNEIPLRGALACDDIYADESSRIFFGKALVEAHKYGEGQDWVGFLLAPSAEGRARDLDLLPSEFFRPWQVGIKGTKETLQAFRIDSIPLSVTGGDGLHALRRMGNRVADPKLKLYYARAIKFLSSGQAV